MRLSAVLRLKSSVCQQIVSNGVHQNVQVKTSKTYKRDRNMIRPIVPCYPRRLGLSWQQVKR